MIFTATILEGDRELEVEIRTDAIPKEKISYWSPGHPEIFEVRDATLLSVDGFPPTREDLDRWTSDAILEKFGEGVLEDRAATEGTGEDNWWPQIDG